MSDQIIQLWPHGDNAFSADDFAPYLELKLLDRNATAAGLVLVLPGGGYIKRADHEGAPVAEAFNERGFHAAVLQYRVAPNFYPAPLRDAVRAIRILRSQAEKLHFDPEHLAILGFSAGAHLAGLSGTGGDKINADAGDEIDRFPARPDAMVLCYPVISLCQDFGHFGSGTNLLGDQAANEENRRDFSLQNRVADDTPPAFLWHTATDNGVPVRNSVEFARAMWEHHRLAELHIFAEGHHGLGLANDYPDIRQWPDLAAKFLSTKCQFPTAK